MFSVGVNLNLPRNHRNPVSGIFHASREPATIHASRVNAEKGSKKMRQKASWIRFIVPQRETGIHQKYAYPAGDERVLTRTSDNEKPGLLDTFTSKATPGGYQLSGENIQPVSYNALF